MYNTGLAKSKRTAFDCFLAILPDISGRFWQILDRSGKKIILLSSLILYIKRIKLTPSSNFSKLLVLLKSNLKLQT